MTIFLFYLFTSLVILSFILVLYNYNPIFSMFFLILGFINVSGIFLLFNSEFIALIFILIYVGAISVLFLFIIMMIHIKRYSILQNSVFFISITTVLSFFFCFLVIYIILNDSVFLIENSFLPYTDWIAISQEISILESLGNVLYSYYFYYFILIGLILLLAMIGSIILTIRQVTFVKQQYIFEQSSRSYTRNSFLVGTESEESRQMNRRIPVIYLP